MNIIVTGSSGMIGTALCKSLKKNHKVLGVDIRTGEQTDILHDLTRRCVTRKATHGVKFKNVKWDMIIHMAAHTSVYPLVREPGLALGNIKMHYLVLETARLLGIKKFIFTSSREVYGNQSSFPVSEDAADHRMTESPYTASKVAGEAWLYAYRNCYGIDFKILRFSNVYGKYDHTDRFIPKLVRQLKKDAPFIIYGTGKILDLSYIDDCVSGIETVINQWDQAPDEINIASGVATTLVEVVEKMKKIMGSKSRIEVGHGLTGEVWKYQADIRRIIALGWRPEVGLQEGLEKTVKYYEAYAKTHK